MITLPKDEKLTPKNQPRNFFIWGETMSGKSYFSSFFPHPLVLNTDGNSAQGRAPSIQIRNIRDANGNLKQSAIKQLDDIIIALQQPGVTFRTIVVDVIDDICVMIEQAICLENNAQALADIPYGKGYSMFNSILQEFVMELKALPLNVIYISRELTTSDERSDVSKPVPSLKPKYYNIVNGNCDLVIRTQKIGKNYYRSVEAKRADYKREDIEDKKVLQLLDSCRGMFPVVKKEVKEGK